MARRIGDAFVRVRPDTKTFGADAGREVESKLSSTMKRVGVAAGAVLASALVGVLGSSIGAARDLGETQSKVKQIFGDSAGAVEAFAGTAAKSLGQSKQSALDAAATFATFGKGAGLAGQDLVGFSTEMTTLASDLASFNNTSPEQAIEAIGAALRGESEPIRAYGVLLDDAALRAEALKLGLVKTTKEALTPQQKVLAAQSAILKQTGDAQGDFQRTSGGLANQQRILTAQWENAKTTLGQALLPILTQAAAKLSEFATYVAENIKWLGPLSLAIGGVVAAMYVVTGVTKAYTVVAGAMKALHVAQIAKWIGHTAAIVAHGVAMAAVRVATLVWTAAQWLLNVALTANPIGLVIVGIAALIAIIVLIATKTTWFQTIWKYTWGGIKAAAQAVGSWFAGPFAGFFVRLWNGIVAGVRAMVSEWTARFNLARSVATAILNAIVSFVRGRINAIISVVRGVIAVVSAIRNAFDSARAAAVDRLGALLSFVRSLPGKVVGALGNLASLLYNAGRNVVQGLINGIMDKIGALASAASNLAGTIRDYLPFSPAKKGPLSGRGNPFYSGRSIGRMLARGLTSEAGRIEAAMAEVLPVAGGGSRAAAAGGAAGFAGGRGGIHVDRVEIKSFSDRFSTRQVMEDLAMHGVH